MQLKTVVKVDYQDDKGKQKLMKTATSFSGIASISVEDNKLTVIGEVDPIKFVKKLRKVCNAHIDTTGPLEEPKKEVTKKDEPKQGGAEKDPKKEEEKKKAYFEELAKVYESFNRNRYCTAHYIVYSAEENPNSCVTC